MNLTGSGFRIYLAQILNMLIGFFDIQTLTKKLVLESSFSSIDAVEKMLTEIRDQYDIEEEKQTAIWVVLNEAVANAIRHGNKFDPSKKVLLKAKFIKNRYLRFKVKDEGEGFDPALVPDPTSAERVAEPDGRGIFLMKKLADSILYSDFGKTLEITFDLQKNAD
ncbi:MAG: serine/threonine protein kinase [Bacteroidetes bacterium]|nr:serine/threonine protein kinase [Bacteroidota bacterium]